MRTGHEQDVGIVCTLPLVCTLLLVCGACDGVLRAGQGAGLPQDGNTAPAQDLGAAGLPDAGAPPDAPAPGDGREPDLAGAADAAAGTGDAGSGTAASAWWRRHFKQGASRFMKRSYNVGYVFYNTAGGDPQKWIAYMGAEADVMGGGLTGGGARVKDWPQVCGGDLSATVQGAQSGSQLDLSKADHLTYWFKTAPAGTWGVLGLTTVPFFWKPAGKSYLDGWEQVGAGAYDAWYVKMGQRLRWMIDHKTTKDHRDVILRPNWEMNQDTGFRPAFFANGGYVKLYNKMLKRFADSFRKGYGYSVPIAFSPAGQPACLPLNKGDTGCTASYADFFEHPGVYQLADASYHPSKQTASTLTQVAAALNGWSGRYALAKEVIPLARSLGLAVSVLEWSPRWEAPPLTSFDYFPPLGAQAVEGLADLLQKNSDVVAFSCAHDDRFINEGFWLKHDPKVKGPAWKLAVQAHKKRFGALP